MNEERRELNVDYWMGSHFCWMDRPLMVLALALSKCPEKVLGKISVKMVVCTLTLSSTTMTL
jgi:hypothetical protein